MPSADEPLEHFETPEQPHPAAEEEDPWGFNTPPSATEHTSAGRKKKAKKKLKKNATPALPGPPQEAVRIDDVVVDESAAYPESVAPSPPQEQGVKLLQAAHAEPSTTALGTSPLAGEPLVNFDDDDSSPTGQVEPTLSRRPSTDLPPPTRSPRPAFVEPATYPRTSPSTRPATLHSRQGSLGATHRPSAALKNPPPPRRESFAASTPFPRFVEPPPPHMPQAHFFGLPDFALNLARKPEAGRPAGSDGYCCSLDSLADAGDEASARKAKDVLLVGSDGGMEVYRVLPGKLEVVGRVEGLRGAVIKAKIIPCPDRFDPLQALRPLVAVVVHGPVQEAIETVGDEDDESLPRRYQTTVEVYSLQKQTHLATLYKSARVTAEQPAYNQVSSLPSPMGDLHLSANGRYVVVASGQSGEVYVFTHYPSSGMEDFQYRCVGKFWTALQRPVVSPARPASADASGPPSDAPDPCTVPLFSLGQRWLTVVPPVISSNTSILGAPLLSQVNLSPPGVNTHAAPPQPPVTCEVAGTDVEDAWVRLGRQAAQGLVKYSQRGIQMGIHGWKELTQPSPPGSTGHGRAASKEELFPPTKGPSEDPNRLSREPALVSLIDLDTLLQWEEFKPKHVAPPMATFALVDGCNFVSLSASGTRLLTTSRKGEISLIWDLSQVAHGVAHHTRSLDEFPYTGQCIKQLHRIARSTPSTVLSCAWSRDSDALALLTAHGTLHLHEIPSRPLPKKRVPRPRPSPSPSLEKSTPTTSLSLGLSPPSSNPSFLTSLKSSWQNVSTHVTSLRGSAPANLGLPTSFAGFRDATAAAGNAGSRAVARGLTQGFAVAKDGASDYWHADDNKIRLKALVASTSGALSSGPSSTSPASIRWIRRSSPPALAVACVGKLHICPVSSVVRRKGDTSVTGLKSERHARKTFALPAIASGSMAAMHDALVEEGYDDDEFVGGRGRAGCGALGPHGFWSLRSADTTVSPHPLPAPLSHPSSMSSRASSSMGAAGERRRGSHLRSPSAAILGRTDPAVVGVPPGSQDDDVETNPPYCPFHVDVGVAILAFDDEGHMDTSIRDFEAYGQGFDDEEAPWPFGGGLPGATRVNDGEGEESVRSVIRMGKGGNGDEEIGFGGGDVEFGREDVGLGREGSGLGGEHRNHRGKSRGLDDEEEEEEEGGSDEPRVESTVTIRRSGRKSGEGQIRINTRRKGRGNAGSRGEGEDGEWGLMDEV